MSDYRDEDEHEVERHEQLIEPIEEPVEEAVPVVQPDAKPATEPRMTHPAMTWKEELEWALELEESGAALTDEQVAHIEQIKQTAADHKAIEDAEKEAAAPKDARREA